MSSPNVPEVIQGDLRNGRPKVSVILPTYNRSRFLPQAFQAIRAQAYSDWELVIIDDGSTDETPALVRELSRDLSQTVHYVFQHNQGPYAARNTGLDHARGQYIAFYDSDDRWLPHHLQDCVDSLDSNPEVDWVYAASRILDDQTGQVLTDNTFFVEGKPRAFLRLRTQDAGKLNIVKDPRTLTWMLRYGLHCGLQTSVIRRRVFERHRFLVRPDHEAEDRFFFFRTVALGFRIGYINDVHLLYLVHDGNSSAAARGKDYRGQLRILNALVQAREELKYSVPLSSRERRALDQRLSSELFWNIGYALHWQNGHRREALEYYRRALRLNPWNILCWKTYLLGLLRALRSSDGQVTTAPQRRQPF